MGDTMHVHNEDLRDLENSMIAAQTNTKKASIILLAFNVHNLIRLCCLFNQNKQLIYTKIGLYFRIIDH